VYKYILCIPLIVGLLVSTPVHAKQGTYSTGGEVEASGGMQQKCKDVKYKVSTKDRGDIYVKSVSCGDGACWVYPSKCSTDYPKIEYYVIPYHSIKYVEKLK